MRYMYSSTCSCLLIAATAGVVQTHSDNYSSYWDPDGVHDESGAKGWWSSYSMQPKAKKGLWYVSDNAMHVSDAMYLEDGEASYSASFSTNIEWADDDELPSASFDSFSQPMGSMVLEAEVSESAYAITTNERASNLHRDVALIFGAWLMAMVVIAAIVKQRRISTFASDDPRLLGEWVIPIAGGAAAV